MIRLTKENNLSVNPITVEFEGRTNKLTSSVARILEILANRGEVSVSELKNEMQVSKRTIQYALKRLMDNQIIDRRPYLADLRQSRYYIRGKFLAEIDSTHQSFILGPLRW